MLFSGNLMSGEPKYSLLEIERRWLVDLTKAGNIDQLAYCQIDDLYLRDSRLRLRKVTSSNLQETFKLGKKYGKRTVLSEPITNLYLTENEYQSFCMLSGDRVRKRRYTIAEGKLDVYLEPHSGLAIFEIEFVDEKSAKLYVPPSFVTHEITNDSLFNGQVLAQNRVVENGVCKSM
jgi:CYTH domain-containing protein